VHETNKDINDEEFDKFEEYELDFYTRILKALIEIYEYNSKENE
jgi:hypothetical protein